MCVWGERVAVGLWGCGAVGLWGVGMGVGGKSVHWASVWPRMGAGCEFGVAFWMSRRGFLCGAVRKDGVLCSV